MKKFAFISIISLLILNCNFEKPTEFTEEVLNVELTDLDKSIVKFETLLEQHKGQKILIDVWASWCRDCIEGLPELRKIQAKHPEVAFVFLSLDRSISGWKNGIKRYDVKGEHYFLNSGWDGPMDDFLNLNWIPRYLVVDETGKISLFKATKITDNDIEAALIN